jgi:hypothetical protein
MDKCPRLHNISRKWWYNIDKDKEIRTAKEKHSIRESNEKEIDNSHRSLKVHAFRHTPFPL